MRTSATPPTVDGYAIGTECEMRFRDDGAASRFEAVVNGPLGAKVVADERCAGRDSDEARRSARSTLVVRLVNSGWGRIPGETPDGMPRFRKITEPQNVHVDMMRRMYGGSSGSTGSAAPAVRRPLWTPTIPANKPAPGSLADDSATGSSRETFFIVGALGIGVLFALALPSLHVNADTILFGGGAQDAAFSELYDGLGALGGRWTIFVAVLGVLAAGLAAFQLPVAESRLPSWIVTIGAATTLLVPIAALNAISKLTSEGAAQGVAVSGSLGAGLILASLAFIVAAALPWVPGLGSKH